MASGLAIPLLEAKARSFKMGVAGMEAHGATFSNLQGCCQIGFRPIQITSQAAKSGSDQETEGCPHRDCPRRLALRPDARKIFCSSKRPLELGADRVWRIRSRHHGSVSSICPMMASLPMSGYAVFRIRSLPRDPILEEPKASRPEDPEARASMSLVLDLELPGRLRAGSPWSHAQGGCRADRSAPRLRPIQGTQSLGGRDRDSADALQRRGLPVGIT